MENSNKEQYQQTIEKRQTKLKEALINTLKEMPIIEVAVKRIGIGRDTYYRWKAQDQEFFKRSQEAMMQGIEFINDLSESQIITLIKDKKMSSIKFWLKHNHPKYRERIEITTNTQPQEELNPEQALIVKEALRLSSMPELTVSVDDDYVVDKKKNESEMETLTPAEQKPPTKPVTVAKNGTETTYLPGNGKVIKYANGASVHYPPDPDNDFPAESKPMVPNEPNNIFRTEAW